MHFWDIASLLAWVIAAGLGLWMVLDAVKVQREHSEDFLTSSQEGADELVELFEKNNKEQP